MAQTCGLVTYRLFRLPILENAPSTIDVMLLRSSSLKKKSHGKLTHDSRCQNKREK